MLELKIAWRFLIEGKKQTILMLSGIAIGVAVQIFLFSLITGLQVDLINKTVGSSPHITVTPPKKSIETTTTDSLVYQRSISGAIIQENTILEWNKITDGLKRNDQVVAMAPFADGSGYLAKGTKLIPVFVRGTISEDADGIYQLRSRMVKGQFQTDTENILIGTVLSEELNASTGDSVRITTSVGTTDIFRIAGIFDLGNESLNGSWIFMDLNRTQKLFAFNGGISSIELQLADVFKADEIKNALQSTYQNVDFSSWQEANAQLLTALSSQSSSSNVIQVFVLLAVALGISSVLAVSVMQKAKQIGILKAMGAKNSMTANIFILQGGILGIAGSILGAGIGIGLLEMFMFFTTKDGQVLFPIEISISSILFSILIATLIGIVSAFIPARSSAKLNPMEVIQNG